MIRTELEAREHQILSSFAAKSDQTLGRLRPEEECDIRTCYMRDRDRIMHSKSFRRLRDKTQVFLSPQGDHYRTRMTHTLEVSQTARTAARCLMLNEDLVEAIALGHDLGHTPFGHAGERTLNELVPGGFSHSQQSVRLVEVLEKEGKGLNLTREVIDGIRNHGTDRMPATLEGQIVRFCDKISYVHHDVDDAVRAGIIKESDIPKDLRDLLGGTTRERLNTFIHDLVESSRGKDKIYMSSEIEEGLFALRNYLFENLYRDPSAKSEEGKVRQMLTVLYNYYLEHPDQMGPEYAARVADESDETWRAVCDYVSGMTDQYAIACFTKIYVPRVWEKY